MAVGTLPAEVWGCFKKPASVSLTISLRIVAGETPKVWYFSIASEEIGSPDLTYKSTIAVKSCFCLSERSVILRLLSRLHRVHRGAQDKQPLLQLLHHLPKPATSEV